MNLYGVQINPKKTIYSGLLEIYGMGPTRIKNFLTLHNISKDMRVKDITNELEVILLHYLSQFTLEVDLRKEKKEDILLLMGNGCYRGTRHKKGYPCRGQRTHTNGVSAKKSKKY